MYTLFILEPGYIVNVIMYVNDGSRIYLVGGSDISIFRNLIVLFRQKHTITMRFGLDGGAKKRRKEEKKQIFIFLFTYSSSIEH